MENEIAWLTRNQLEKLQKIAQNYEKCLGYSKYVLPLFHIVRKNPLKKLEHQVDSHDDIEILSVENNRLTNGQLINGCLKRQLRLITK